MATGDDPHLSADPGDRRDLRPAASKRLPALAGTALLVAAVITAALWWTQRTTPSGQPPTQPASTVPQAQSPASAPLAAEPVVKYPLPPAADTQALLPSGIGDALSELLGRRAVETFLYTEDFARRFVATVDSLGREHAPPAAWPIAPTPGRFTVEEGVQGTVIARDNAARYTPLVLLTGTVDAGRAVQLYQRMYPLLQQAYRELGFGDRYFNDRVIEVIDLLLATPEPGDPPRVQLTEVKGPIPTMRPWTRYEFADARLENLAAGQKILVRVGPANQRRLKNKLRELRELLVQVPQPASAGR